jgi:hypothetical protein
MNDELGFIVPHKFPEPDHQRQVTHNLARIMLQPQYGDLGRLFSGSLPDARIALYNSRLYLEVLINF